MSKSKKVIAITCGDIHLSHRPPIARSCEKDWYKVMAGYLRQLRQFAEQHQCPVICTGDIFDDGWRTTRCPPELINFALEHLPDGMYSIPGQHDLPHHRYEDITRSAYWTLVQAGKIENVMPISPLRITDEIVLHAFPWGYDLVPLDPESGDTHLAVCHKYIWMQGHEYPGAPGDAHVSRVSKKLKGYTAAVFGDNHKGFRSLKLDNGYLDILNGGSFLRRKRDEYAYTPFLGLLLEDGSWGLHHLDTSEDKFLEINTRAPMDEGGQDLSVLVEMMEELGTSATDFHIAVREYLDSKKANKSVRNIIARIMEEDPS